MINIKTKIWELLRKKEVSLAMIVDREGEILWHRGRDIKGRNIDDGKGFPRSCLKQSIKNGKALVEEDVAVAAEVKSLTESALILNIKNLMIMPITTDFFLYLDSGVRESFSDKDREVFQVLGELLGKSIDQIREKQDDRGDITGTSKEAAKIRELVLKYSLEEDPVLVRGETGTGKNHIAELIHRYSGRKGNFVTINTPGIPENLFESEMFGHKKGAFTDARNDKKGLVEEARGGTLFFDEIAEVPPTFQAKLLRFIETKKYFVLGGTEEKTADVRIVAATNRELTRAIKKRQFREDLYYRMQVLEINIPPLRERKQDIRALVTKEQGCLKGKEMGPGFREALENHDWPGNIRELKSVLKRAAILAGDTINGEDVKNIINQCSPHSSFNKKGEIVERILEEMKAGKNFWEAVRKPFLDRDINRSQAKEIIRKGLMEAGGRYMSLLPVFNLGADEYHKFMSFLSDHQLK